MATPLRARTVGPSRNGAFARRQALAAALDPPCRVICEATGGYESLVLDAVIQAGHAIHRTDARKVKGFIRSLGILGKPVLSLPKERMRSMPGALARRAGAPRSPSPLAAPPERRQQRLSPHQGRAARGQARPVHGRPLRRAAQSRPQGFLPATQEHGKNHRRPRRHHAKAHRHRKRHTSRSSRNHLS